MYAQARTTDTNIVESVENENDNSNNSDDDSSLGVPLVVLDEQDSSLLPKDKLELPPDGLRWSDKAIQHCFQVAMATHDTRGLCVEWPRPPLGINSNQQRQQQNEDHNQFSIWNPKSLPLPLWAADVVSYPSTT